MNGMTSFDRTDRNYSLASTDNLFRFWKSNVMFMAGLSMWLRRYPHQHLGIKVSSSSLVLLCLASLFVLY